MSRKHGIVIGCVGKPSSGKSTFFNAVSESKVAKVGACPFTTIKPNEGIGHYLCKCPCIKYQVKCKPNFGSCNGGVRTVPVKLLDVAGLIPGASEGLGLGNKFLDDLRHADVLLHIIDVSGTTDEKGEATTGYDPIYDHEWLLDEIHSWIFNNLWKRWTSIVRRHTVKQQDLFDTLQVQLSGYSTTERLLKDIAQDIIGNPNFPETLETWERDHVMALRFPFVLVLNKIDLGGEAEKNVIRIAERFDSASIVCASAITECFLKKMRQQGYISYSPGESTFTTSATDSTLRAPDSKLANRLQNVRDMILFRLGSTGVHEAISKAVERADIFPVFPVKSIATMGATRGRYGAFPECILVKQGTTVGLFAHILHDEIARNLLYTEGPDGCCLSENEVLTPECNIVRFVTRSAETRPRKKKE